MSGENKDNKEFSFITEKIKNKPINKKRVLIRGIMCVCAAIIFGVLASFSFVITKPYFEKLTKEEPVPDKVTIPVDEIFEDVLNTENEENVEPEEEIEEEVVKETIIVNNTVALNIDDFKSLYRELASLASKVNTYMVTVTGVTSEVDLFKDTLENTNQLSGVIFADNGQEVLILTRYYAIKEVEKIVVTFCDDQHYNGSIKSYDPSTDIAVVAVPLEEISEETSNSYTTAVLGNSYTVCNGDLVIAAGGPLGYADSATYGIVTSSTKSVSEEDANYKIITTDAVGSSTASGILSNTNGEVIGFIMPEYTADDSASTVTAIAISDLKKLIERLSNNEELLRLGFKGNEVTSEISEEQFVGRDL